jgi:hypothetical protein
LIPAEISSAAATAHSLFILASLTCFFVTIGEFGGRASRTAVSFTTTRLRAAAARGLKP